MIRVVIADDHDVVREGLKAVLRTQPDVQVVGEAADGLQVIAVVKQCDPDVVLLDLTMPAMNGLESITRLRAECPRARILVLSMHTAPEFVRPALRAGAHGYAVKGSGVSSVVRAVQAVAAGERFLDPRAEQVVIHDAMELDDAVDDIERLTPREREVLQLVAEGATNKEIASKLGLSHKTVDRFRTNLMRKLDLHSAQAVTRFALRKGLISNE